MRTSSGRRLSIEGNLNCKSEGGRPVAVRGCSATSPRGVRWNAGWSRLRLRTQLILDSLTEGIMMIDMQGIITYANTAALRLLGHSDLGFIGKPLHPTVQHSYADGSRYPVALSPVRLTMRDGRRRSIQSEVFWRADGSFFPVEYQINAIYEDGLSIGAVLSFHDVTEQRSAESNQKRLTSIIEASTDFVAIVDRGGESGVSQPRLPQGSGIGENDALAKVSMRDIYTPEIAEKMMTEAIPQTERTGTWSGEAMLRGPYGNIPVLQLFMAHRNDAGSVDFFSSVMRDITERLSIETMKDDFISTVSHELRTPLTSIRGALGLLASGAVGKVPDAGARMIDVAITNSDRLIRLLNDILDIERMDSKKIQLYRAPQRVLDLFAAALEAVKVIADQTGTRILTDCPPDLAVVADYDRMMQTLANLLSNAMKFSPAGAGIGEGLRPHGRRHGADLGRRQWQGHPFRETGRDLRAVPTGGRLRCAGKRRQRPGLGDLPQHRAATRRQDLGGVAGGKGIHVPLHLARRAGDRRRRRNSLIRDQAAQAPPFMRALDQHVGRRRLQRERRQSEQAAHREDAAVAGSENIDCRIADQYRLLGSDLARLFEQRFDPCGSGFLV